MSSSEPRLLTIPMSHYCEKARWALERRGIAYTEVRRLQGFHYIPALLWARSPTVPVLRIDGRTLTDSTDILHHLDQHAPPASRLFPDDPALRRDVAQLESRFDDPLGVDSRRWVYDGYFRSGRLGDIIEIAAQGAPRWQARVLPTVFPLLRAFLSRRLGGLSRDIVAAGVARSREVFDEMAARLADGRPYLCGDRFTAADLTFACMGAPYVLPPQYGIRLPTVGELPADMRPFADEMRAHPAGAFILKLFRDERRRVVL
jgi:glutathione S-transferase